MEASPKTCTVRRVARIDIKDFVEKYHYSGSIRGVTSSHCYGLYHDDKLVGAAIYGLTATSAWKKYGEAAKDVVELRRLVTLDECIRNTESWFIAQTLKLLKIQSEYKVCVSYADPEHEHVGYIYQASNWRYLGTTNKDKVFITPEGKRYHSRAISKDKPYSEHLRKLKKEGLLVTVATKGKHIYIYDLRKKQQPSTLAYPKAL